MLKRLKQAEAEALRLSREVDEAFKAGIKIVEHAVKQSTDTGAKREFEKHINEVFALLNSRKMAQAEQLQNAMSLLDKPETATGGASKKGRLTAPRKRISKTVGHAAPQGGKDPAGKKNKGVHISLTEDSYKESYKDEDFKDY